MGFAFGKTSLSRLEGLDPRLVKLAKHVISISDIDFTITQGLRTLKQSKENKAKGTSFLSNPENSKHIYGMALDFAVLKAGKIDWNDLEAFWYVACLFRDEGAKMGIPIRLGADWKNEGHYKGTIARGTYDGGHVELNEPIPKK